MKSITFGPVTHKGKSYAYALGYGAYIMGHRQTENPYSHTGMPLTHAQWREGYHASINACDAAVTNFIEEYKA